MPLQISCLHTSYRHRRKLDCGLFPPMYRIGPSKPSETCLVHPQTTDHPQTTHYPTALFGRNMTHDCLCDIIMHRAALHRMPPAFKREVSNNYEHHPRKALRLEALGSAPRISANSGPVGGSYGLQLLWARIAMTLSGHWSVLMVNIACRYTCAVHWSCDTGET